MKMQPVALASALILCATLVQAGTNFADSVRIGEEHMRYGKGDKAVPEFETALGQAANNTERGIALGKKAWAYAQQKNYPLARESAEKAIELTDVHPVGRVTALEVRAECYMQETGDYTSAIGLLDEAMKLEGVDWARPSVAMKLGDCHRFEGRAEQALAAYQSILNMPSASNDIKAVAHLNIGITYQYNLRDNEKAKAAYDLAADLNPSLSYEVDGHIERMP